MACAQPDGYRRSGSGGLLEPAGAGDEAGDLGDALVLLQIGEQEGTLAAHLARIAVHHLKARPHQRREIDLVDHQEIGARDARPALARDLVEPGEALAHLGHRGKVDRGVLADRRVRAAAGLDAGDALRRERARAYQELRILFGIDVVGDDGDGVALAHMLAQTVDQRGLPRADRAADADAQRPVMRSLHERKSLVYCVSWRIEHQSRSGAEVPISSSGIASTAVAVAATMLSSAAIASCPSDWPSGTRRTPAETRLPAKACR